MTTANTDRVAEATGNGVTTDFPYPFKIVHPDDLIVVIRTIADGVEVTLDPANYSVALNADNVGGTVIYNPVDGPLASEFKIFITSETPLTQEITVANQRAYDAGVASAVWDKLTIIAQELANKLTRVPLLPLNTPQLTFPAPEDGKVIVGSGDGFINGPTLTEVTSAEQYAQDAEDAKTAVEAILDNINAFDPAGFLTKADNLASLNNAPTARNNLGLGAAATLGTRVGALAADIDLDNDPTLLTDRATTKLAIAALISSLGSGSRQLIDRFDQATLTGIGAGSYHNGGGSILGDGYTWPLFDDALYTSYEFVFENWSINTSGTLVTLNWTVDGGVSYGAEDMGLIRTVGTNTGLSEGNTLYSGDSTNSQNRLFRGILRIDRPKDVQETLGHWNFFRTNGGTSIIRQEGVFSERTVQSLDGLRITRILSGFDPSPLGVLSMYGVRK